MIELVSNNEYKDWINEIKLKILRTQTLAIKSANNVLIRFYWELGKDISEKLEAGQWGSKLIEQIAKDLKKELPEIKGFSRTNLYYISQFYKKFSQASYQKLFVNEIEQKANKAIVPQLGGQLPWSHIKVLISKVKDPGQTYFYIRETINNGWSRDVLSLQIKSQLYERQGKAVSNFEQTLPSLQSDLAQQTIKDPYVFDFLSLSQPYHEKDIEKQLISHISKFLLELGKGFAFIGQQYHLEIADQDYYLDLLFYHVKLKCYVVIELKNKKFIPEYAGKLNFYLSAVDELIKDESDKPTIGILLCRDKNNVEVEFSLRGMKQPMGVSEFIVTEKLPENLKSSLPTIEEIEQELESKP